MNTCDDCKLPFSECRCGATSYCAPPMSRRAEVEAKIECICWTTDWKGDALTLRGLCRTLADEIDALRATLAALREVVKSDEWYRCSLTDYDQQMERIEDILYPKES